MSAIVLLDEKSSKFETPGPKRPLPLSDSSCPLHCTMESLFRSFAACALTQITRTDFVKNDEIRHKILLGSL